MSNRNNSGRNNRDSSQSASDANYEDYFVTFEKLTPHQLKELKESLLNMVASALIQQPRISVTDPTIKRITKTVKKIAFYDPEFILKLAIYVRLDLNIRSTANYLLSVASNIKECTPYFKKYFVPTIRLPSDWLDVAATYLMLPDKGLDGKSLPTAMRNAMVIKFPDFDAYQLGKYNKERTIKRKLKKNKEEKSKNPERLRAGEKPMITLKQMIRQLHISKPPLNVMCLLGKKYPSTETQFRDSGLPGKFESERAGRRMKLPTPETWETLLSAKGNKASTWEELIEHKKLPFMAMLRNLRNLIYTGVHPRYHKWAQNKLSNPGAVANSRQFPFQFFSAYEVIPKDLEHFKQLISGQSDAKKPGDDKPARRKKKKPIVPAIMPTDKTFEDYRKAIDEAVKLATVHNVQPIRGSTVVFCNVSSETRQNASGAKGMGSSVRKIQEIGYLLGLMCKYVCEDCDFRIYASPSASNPDSSHIGVELSEGTILDNMKIVADQASKLGDDSIFPYDYLEDLIRTKRKIDNLLVLSHVMINPHEGAQSKLANLLTKYRSEVNPDLLYVSVDLSGSGKNTISNDEKNPNDIMIAGFSDQILRFIAERGDTTQLQYVEHIDEAKSLNKAKEQPWEISPWWKWLDTLGSDAVKYPNIVTGPAWKTARVFISSTFLDMHGERDVLTRIVFPELKEKAKKLKLQIFEVDLRWGVTEEEAQHGKSLQLCLDEVERCRPFFIGMLGDRYGWAPAEYDLPDINHPRFSWIKSYPKDRSITELEMQLAALSNPGEATGAFFYFRDHSLIHNIPEEHRSSFLGNPEDSSKMEALKDRIRDSGLPLFEGYPAEFGLDEEGKPTAKNLKVFAERVFNDIWGAIQEQHLEDEPPTDPVEIERSHHQAVAQALTTNFVGRAEMMDQLKRFTEGVRGQIMVVTGKPGDGKSALLANFAKVYAEKNPSTFILPHFIGASPSSNDIAKTLRRLCSELKTVFELNDPLPDTYKDLCNLLPVLLEQAAFKGKLVVIIDAINQLDPNLNRSHTMEWLPTKLPCKFIVSSTTDSKILESLRRRFTTNLVETPMTPLNPKDRAEIVKTILWQYHKKLDDRPMNNQLRVLLKKVDASTPLYLTVACEELRVFGVFEQISDRIKAMGEKLPKLFEEVLIRLELDHGKLLVQDTCSLIGVSRGGLLESEIRALISVTDKSWVSFLRSLSAFLKPSGEGELTFFHQQFLAAVTKRYIPNPRAVAKYHVKLAEGFYDKGDPMKDGRWSGGNDVRAIRELPYHLTKAEKWDQLTAVLTDLSFIELKVSHDLLYDLIEDYNVATGDGVPNYDGKKTVREFKDFVKANSHVLHRNPSLTFQQAANQPQHTAPAKEAHGRWDRHEETRSWVMWINKPHEKDPCKMTYSGYQEGLTATTYSSDGSFIAAASRDCSIKIYNSETGTELCTLTGHSNWIVDLKFSVDNRQLYSASWDESIKVWDIDLHTCSYTLTGHKRRVSSIATTKAGDWLASASWDCTVKLWETRGGQPECKQTITIGNKPINSCAFVNEDKQLMVATWDGKIKIFNIEDEKEVKVLQAHKKSVSTIAYSPLGKQMVSGGLDRDLILWDAQAGKPISTLTQHAKPITMVSYTADGSHLLSSSADFTTKVWDANLGQEKKCIKVECGNLLCCSFHPSIDTRLATGTSDCDVIVWDLTEGKQILKLEGHTRAVVCVEYSPDGKEIASSGEDGLIIIWNADTGEKIHNIKAHNGPISSIAWSPVKEDKRLVSGGDDFMIKIWNTDTAKETIESLSGHTSVVKGVCFDQRGKLIASVSRDNTLRTWDSRSGKQLQSLRGHLDWLNCVHFSENGNKVVTGSWDYTLKLWNLRRGDAVGTMRGHESAISNCKYSPDGKTIVSSSFDGTLKIWDAESATEITTLTGHETRVNGFSFSPDGKYLASVSDDSTIRIWDPLTATEVSTLIGHAGSIRSATFSPTNKQIITCGDDRTLKTWDVGLVKEETSGGYGFSYSSSYSSSTQDKPEKVQTRITGHSGMINSVNISTDGARMVSTSDDCSYSVWDLTTAQRLINTKRKNIESIFTGANFIEDNRCIVTSSDDGLVIMWDTRTKKKVRDIAKHKGPATSVHVSGNGYTVVSSGWDSQVLISDSRKENSYRALSGHEDWLLSAAISDDARYAVSGGWDNTLRLWDAQSYNLRFPLPGHTQPITSVAISADSRFIASASFDSSVKIWNTVGGKLEKTLAGHIGRVNDVTFGPKNDSILLTCGNDHTIKLWDISNFHLRNEFVCQSPATACAIKKVSNLDDLIIVGGDSIGNIYLAKLLTYH